jgi:hypothetical protein
MPSRRHLLRGLVAVGVGLGGLLLPGVAGARKTRTRTREKRRRNPIGCVNVGKPCRGNDRLCCSGICQGKKPKKGKRDTSRCAAHDATTCQAGDQDPGCTVAELVICTTSTGYAGICATTTGNAGYCHASTTCFACATDAECKAVCGARAACLPCTACAATGGTMCASTDDLGCAISM